MSEQLIAIGIDGADIDVIERWCEQGLLPNLAKYRARSKRVRLQNLDRYRAEIPWTTFLTGVTPEQTGYWGRIRYSPDNCSVDEYGSYDFVEYPPFYALQQGKKVCVFDMPQTRIQSELDGIQVLAWGAHSPRGPSISQPEQLFGELTEAYGKHPRLNDDHANIYDPQAARQLRDDFITGIQARTNIAKDLLQREDWDLFLMMFSESHSAGHTFWHNDQRHPLQGKLQEAAHNYHLDVFKAVDASIGEILNQRPESQVVFFSVHGMVSNVLDVGSMLMLPEFCYRSFLNKNGALAVKPEHESSQQSNDFPEHWSAELWKRSCANQPQLQSPQYQRKQGMSLAWQAANWYQKLWRQMPVFALPSYSDGYLRCNIAGRDDGGQLDPEDYSKTLDEIESSLMQMHHPATEAPIVRDCIRTRTDPLDDNPKLPDADMIVLWEEGEPFDTVMHPTLGQFGPVPHFRTGGHRNLGFAWFSGTEIDAGDLQDDTTLKLTSTLMQLIGMTPPQYMEKPLRL